MIDSYVTTWAALGALTCGLAAFEANVWLVAFTAIAAGYALGAGNDRGWR